jgi:hypothetical protein
MVGIKSLSGDQGLERHYEPPLLEVFGSVEDLTHHGCTHAGDDALSCRAPGKGFQGSVITPGAG